MKYKVLLIDDQHSEPSLDSIKDLAKMVKIELIGVRFHVQGMEILKNDSSFEYQAVILDATGYKKSDIDEAEESNKGLFYSLKFLSELKPTRIIPWFIYTGAQRNLTKEDFMEPISEYQNELKFGREDLFYYTKTLHEKELLQDIKIEIDKLEVTKIEYKHKRIFQIAKKLNIPDEEINQLVLIIKSIQSNAFDLEPSLYFTQLRKYLEYVFRDAAKQNILHEKCIGNEGKINLSDSSLFLAGEWTKYSMPNKVRCTKAHFSKIMSENIKNFLFITGAASHTSDVDPAKNMDYQSYREQIKTPYLLYSLTFQLMDIFIWFDEYVKENPDPEENKKLWIEIIEESEEQSWIGGKLESINDSGYGTFKPNNDSPTINIRPVDISQHKLIVGDRLEVVTKLSNDGKKTHIKRMRKINIE
jgi:hypothetical protein